MLQIPINIFRSVKMEIKSFVISYYSNIFFHHYNDLIEFCKTFLVVLLYWHHFNDLIEFCKFFLVVSLYCYKRYSIHLILFSILYKLFPSFIGANNIGSLVNNLFGVKIFNHFDSLTSSSPTSGGMKDKSTDSS